MKNIVRVLIISSLFYCQAHANTTNELTYEKLISEYIEWALKIDQQGAKLGEKLNKKQLTLAAEIGVKSPEKIRIVYVEEVPFPYENLGLKAMGEKLGFIGEKITNNAQVFGYSIYVRKGFELNRPRMAHEFVHVLQIERSSFAEHAIQHLSDLAKYGYKNAPLEVEAFEANRKYAIE